MDAASIFTLCAGAGFFASAIAMVVIALRHAPSEAASLVLAERRRQEKLEGYSLDHDDEHTLGQLAAAAACYAIPPSIRTVPAGGSCKFSIVGQLWPWCRTHWKPTPEDRIRELTKAGALILAEIERQLREKKRMDWEGGAS